MPLAYTVDLTHPGPVPHSRDKDFLSVKYVFIIDLLDSAVVTPCMFSGDVTFFSF